MDMHVWFVCITLGLGYSVAYLIASVMQILDYGFLCLLL
jgi:hypothetical protein